MGTSDSFGGSNTNAWSAAKSAAGDAASGGSATAVQAQALAALLGKALGRGSRNGQSIPIEQLLGRHRGAENASSSGGGRAHRTTSSTSRQAARGGAVIAGFDAWRRGDASHAQQCGLDLSRLNGLDERALCTRLVDDVLGPPAHPDDVALRKSLIEVLRKAMKEDPPPTVTELLDRFIEALTWEMSVVQIAADFNANRIPASKIPVLENKVRRFIRGSIRQLRERLKSSSPQHIVNYAAKLADRACKTMGK